MVLKTLDFDDFDTDTHARGTEKSIRLSAYVEVPVGTCTVVIDGHRL